MVLGSNNSVNELNLVKSQLDKGSNNGQIELSVSTPSDPQVKASVAPRRKFTKAYKLQILTSYDACSNALERGALLRREGLYQGCISAWRNQLEMNTDGKKTTSKGLRTDHMAREIEQLKKKLAQAQAVIDLQKKVSELLGTHILSHDSSEVN
jgi:transposase-like protein